MHFNNRVSLLDEEENSVFKSEIESFTDDLNTIVDKSIIVYDRQRSIYRQELHQVIIRLSHSLRKLIFRDLTTFVTFFDLRLVLN